MIELIKESGAVHPEGKVGYSGNLVKPYIDLRIPILSYPLIRSCILSNLKSVMKPEINVVIGGGVGGSALAVAYGTEYNIPVNLVRNTKKTYGTGKIVEGKEIKDGKVGFFDDALTTGKSLLGYIDKLITDTNYKILGIYTIVTGMNDRELAQLSKNFYNIPIVSLSKREEYV